MKPSLTIAIDDAVARYREATPLSMARFEQTCRVMPGANTRSILHYGPYPVTITRGEGCIVQDLDENRYADFLGEYSAGLYGHSNPQISAAVKGALDQGIVLCAPNPYESELAGIICSRFPACEQIRFCNSGTEANLLAVSTAKVHTGRRKVMVFNGGYHGSVFYFGKQPGLINAPFEFVVGPYNDPQACSDLIREHQADLAAILVEPMQGSGGCIPGDRAFLLALREMSDQIGAVLIFDEVMTSRLSSGGLQRTLNIAPDMTTFGKYMGGGLTFGAFGGKEEIMARFDPRRSDAIVHAGTFNNNVLSMVAGLTGLRDIYTEQVATDHNLAGRSFQGALQRIIDERELPMHVSGIGSLLCIHFQRERLRNLKDDQSAPLHRSLFQLEMLLAGIYTANRGFMSLSLSLGVDEYREFQEQFIRFLDRHGELLGDQAMAAARRIG